MITSISLKFGRTPGSNSEKIDLTPITVFVGPNNSGKSRILQEISQRLSTGQHLASEVIIDSIEYEVLTRDEVNRYFEHLQLKPTVNETINVGHVIVGRKGNRYQVTRDSFFDFISNPLANPNAHATYLLNSKSLYLGGANRLDLIVPQAMGDLKGDPSSSLQYIFKDDTLRKRIRDITFRSFGKYFVIDPTNSGQLHIRLSDREPESPTEERALDDSAIAFHLQARGINEFSDGIKAFVGLLIESVAGDPEILLIDEPETFLHPSLAHKFGNELSKIQLGERKRIFISTHSASFVMGCVHSGAQVNIIRLTYQSGQGTARVLNSRDLTTLMRNPLLRSIGVMSALFYENVVVTESDSDRAFYQEINERLLAYDPERAIPNCLFLNAQNKQTVHLIIKPLRDLGIPVAGIVDIDILKDGGTVFANFLNGGYLPEFIKQSMTGIRTSLKTSMEASGLNMKRDGGIAILNDNDKRSATHLFDQLDEHGLFTVRSGELESWLKSLSGSGHGSAWLIEMFEKMGDTPDSPDYVKPQNGDVWDFIAGIRQWLLDPRRKGMPS